MLLNLLQIFYFKKVYIMMCCIIETVKSRFETLTYLSVDFCRFEYK